MVSVSTVTFLMPKKAVETEQETVSPPSKHMTQTKPFNCWQTVSNIFEYNTQPSSSHDHIQFDMMFVKDQAFLINFNSNWLIRKLSLPEG